MDKKSTSRNLSIFLNADDNLDTTIGAVQKSGAYYDTYRSIEYPSFCVFVLHIRGNLRLCYDSQL